MKLRIALVLIAAASLGSPLMAGETFRGTWWNSVAYRKGRFEPAVPRTGRPPLSSHTTWESEKSPRGTIIRVKTGFLIADEKGDLHPGTGYLTADETGLVHVSPTLTPGSYWEMKAVNTEDGTYNAKADWRGTWSRTTYTLESVAPGLRGGKFEFRDGKLTVHPRNKGLAILSVTRIHAREISGK